MSVSPTYSECFACGSDNPIGLKLKFHSIGEGKVESTFVADKVYQGYEGVLHGGLVATILDEAMAHAVLNLGTLAATAKMELRWRKPVPIGQPLRVVGEVMGSKSRAYEAKATVILPDGKVAAEAKGLFMQFEG